MARNVETGRESDTHLRDLGWTVLRVWEYGDPGVRGSSRRGRSSLWSRRVITCLSRASSTDFVEPSSCSTSQIGLEGTD